MSKKLIVAKYKTIGWSLPQYIALVKISFLIEVYKQNFVLQADVSRWQMWTIFMGDQI